MPEMKCVRCGYRWLARVDRPKACPECKSRNWRMNKTKKRSVV